MGENQKKLIQERFTRTAEVFTRYAVEESDEYVRRKIEFIVPQSHEHALDIACGPGTLALALRPAIARVCGIDLTEKMLRLARERAAEKGFDHADLVRGDVEQLPFPERSFDIVCCGQSFHHFLRPAVILAEMRRVTKPDGRIAVFDSMAPEEDARARLHDLVEKTRDPSHTHSLKHSEFLSLFRRARLRLECEQQLSREQWFSKWAYRADLHPETEAFRLCRQMLLDSIAGDEAGFEPEVVGDDIRFIHHEGYFLLKRNS